MVFTNSAHKKYDALVITQIWVLMPFNKGQVALDCKIIENIKWAYVVVN